MNNKADIVKKILQTTTGSTTNSYGRAFAPTNIALCKYWGKRDEQINLPVTNSLSISLAHLGALTKIEIINSEFDQIILNNNPVQQSTSFYTRAVNFLNLFRFAEDMAFKLTIEMNIPVAAGVASSACGFASIVLALNDLFAWNLEPTQLSILARLGSGSACRSLWDGFVEWDSGTDSMGMDCYAYPLEKTWIDFRVGLLLFSSQEKYISSRTAMRNCVQSCPFYKTWPDVVADSLQVIKQAINDNNFWELGQAAENNALSMHALMLSTIPPVIYATAETLQNMHRVWQVRAGGVPLFFTQDAGPNLKLLFLKKHEETVKEMFSSVQIVKPFTIKETVHV